MFRGGPLVFAVSGSRKMGLDPDPGPMKKGTRVQSIDHDYEEIQTQPSQGQFCMFRAGPLVLIVVSGSTPAGLDPDPGPSKKSYPGPDY
mgnify:CR=1 FL=1